MTDVRADFVASQQSQRAPLAGKVWSTQVCRVLEQLRFGKKCWCAIDGNSRYPHTATCIDAAGLYRQAGGRL